VRQLVQSLDEISNPAFVPTTSILQNDDNVRKFQRLGEAFRLRLLAPKLSEWILLDDANAAVVNCPVDDELDDILQVNLETPDDCRHICCKYFELHGGHNGDHDTRRWTLLCLLRQKHQQYSLFIP
jgi:hypothetical protein